MAKLVKKSNDQERECLPNARRIAAKIQSYKAKNIKAYYVRDLTVLTDCIILCSATSQPQLKAVFNGVKEEMLEIGLHPLRAEGEMNDNWLVLDYGTIFVHVFRESAYEFYDLDGLWGDAPELDLELDEE